MFQCVNDGFSRFLLPLRHLLSFSSICTTLSSYDTTDKNKRIMERLKWRKQSVINRRLEIAFGPDFGPESVGLFKRLSKKIWRDTYQKDPPPLPASVRATVGRGTKRKASSPGGGGTGGSAAPDRTRNVRSRHARTNDKLA